MTVVLSVGVTEGVTHDEGDRFRVYAYSDPQTPIGEFVVGVSDVARMQGILKWFSPELCRDIDADVFALPPKSPWRFIAGATEKAGAHFAANGSLAGMEYR